MALGLNLDAGNGGQRKFLPIVKFDAKSGDFLAIDRTPQPDGTWEKEEHEIKMPTHVVCDFAALEVGWIGFVENRFDYVMTKPGSKFPACPSPDHKQGVRLRMFFKDFGLREFSHTSKNVLRVIDALHTTYEQEAPKNPGKLPVIEISGTETVKLQTKQGELRFKVPAMEIVKWVAPPKEMAEQAAPAPAPAPAKTAAELDEEF